jgi:hypothetical protein
VVAVAGVLALALIAQASSEPSPPSEPPPPPAQPSPPPVQPVEPIPDATTVRPRACDAPERPPDLRCAENLDGRDSPQTSAGRQAAQAVLAPPRAVARLMLLPVVDVTAGAERHGVFPWLRAITTSDDGKVGVRPEIQYSTGFVGTIGATFFYRRFDDPTSEMLARVRFGRTSVFRAEISARGPRRFGLILGAFWDRRDDRLFAGVGNVPDGAPPPIQARYRGDIYRTEALWYTPGASPLSLILRAGVEGREYDPDDVRGGPSVALAYGAPAATCAMLGLPSPCTDPALVPGFNIDRRLLYQRVRLVLDKRPVGRDASGVEVGLEGGIFHGLAGDPSRQARLGLDGVAQIGGIDRALLLRFVAAVVEPLGNGPIAFDELVSPTGVAGIRGLPDGLLRDRSGFVGTAEYRWLISSAIDASLFVDSGAVAGPWFAGLAPDDIRTSVGLGLRFYGRSLARYWEETASQGVQFAYARGQGLRIMLSVALF